jgi:hypothetical protein
MNIFVTLSVSSRIQTISELKISQSLKYIVFAIYLKFCFKLMKLTDSDDLKKNTSSLPMCFVFFSHPRVSRAFVVTTFITSSSR